MDQIKKKRKLKKKDIRSGRTLALLTELGFYDGGKPVSVKTKTKVEKKETNESKKDEDIVSKLKDLKELFEAGSLTEEEFDKAKKKLLN